MSQSMSVKPENLPHGKLVIAARSKTWSRFGTVLRNSLQHDGRPIDKVDLSQDSSEAFVLGSHDQVFLCFASGQARGVSGLDTFLRKHTDTFAAAAKVVPVVLTQGSSINTCGMNEADTQAARTCIVLDLNSDRPRLKVQDTQSTSLGHIRPPKQAKSIGHDIATKGIILLVAAAIGGAIGGAIYCYGGYHGGGNSTPSRQPNGLVGNDPVDDADPSVAHARSGKILYDDTGEEQQGDPFTGNPPTETETTTETEVKTAQNQNQAASQRNERTGSNSDSSGGVEERAGGTGDNNNADVSDAKVKNNAGVNSDSDHRVDSSDEEGANEEDARHEFMEQLKKAGFPW
eukprot:m.460062 g.460062  ORF g.460062 m.460062 type:complete len:345 (+) comp20342_c6_seq22:245-1279(+)